MLTRRRFTHCMGCVALSEIIACKTCLNAGEWSIFRKLTPWRLIRTEEKGETKYFLVNTGCYAIWANYMHKEHRCQPFSNACDLVRPPCCSPTVILLFSSHPPPGHPRPEEDPHNNQPPEQLNWPQLIFGFVAITLYYLLQGSDPIPEVAFPFFLQQMLNTGEVRRMTDVKVLSGTPHADTCCTACIVHIVHCTASLWMWGRGDTDTRSMHACICT